MDYATGRHIAETAPLPITVVWEGVEIRSDSWTHRLLAVRALDDIERYENLTLVNVYGGN